MVRDVIADSSPAYLAAAAWRRLTYAAMLIVAIYLLYLILYNTVWSGKGDSEAQTIGLCVIVISAALVIVVHRVSHRVAVAVSIAYEVAICLATELTHYLTLDNVGLERGVSWSGPVILFFPLLMSTTPRVTLLGSLLSASMGFVGYHLAGVLGGIRIESVTVLVSYWIPLYLCAMCAQVPAVVLYRLGRDVKQARQMGSYELVEKLGSGGMGEVWRARHRLLARPAAIKIIKAEAHDLRQLEERFEREAQATARLESAHTIKLFDFGRADDGSFYYVMELLRGINLEMLVREFGPLPSERAASLLLQICDSLSEAHAADMIHRDIKPANIQICRSAQYFDFVKVLDFGLVKIPTETRSDLQATQEGRIVGTPAYLAPEIAIGDQPVDGRADLYALGCVAYYMLTGHAVFTQNTPMKLAIAHATAAPERPSTRLGCDLPRELEEIVLACLNKKVDERPSTAAELASRLKATGLASHWTQERAALWWDENLHGELLSKTVGSEASTEPTAFLNPVPS
ncbi:MAG: serine/threonine protein kinase [Myxococcales bacterium]|nr:serine/threonine protein kinase [Myxococcales bacterium]